MSFATLVNENIKIILYYQMLGNLEFVLFKAVIVLWAIMTYFTQESYCFVSRFVVGVRWLEVFAGDELYDLTYEIWPWCLILNTDFKDQPGTHELDLYKPKATPIELFYSYGLSTINYI